MYSRQEKRFDPLHFYRYTPNVYPHLQNYLPLITVRCFPCFLTIFTFLFAGTPSPKTSSPKIPKDTSSSQVVSSQTYEVHFISLKRGHTIAPSQFFFGQEDYFEVRIPHESFMSTRGSYVKHTLQFEAYWEGTLSKHHHHYFYTFTIKGVSLLDAFIAGVLHLEESITETHQKQKATFFFAGTSLDSGPEKQEPKTPFPF